MHRLISLIVIVVALSAGALGPSGAQEAAPPPDAAATAELARTNVRYFLPFTGDGLNAALTVTSNESGSCIHESLSSPGRPDAWGCIGETSNEIFDPCFESPFSTPDEPGELACVDSPFSRDVVLFTPTAPLPRFKEADGGPPPPELSGAMPQPAAPLPPKPGTDKPAPGSPPDPPRSGSMAGGLPPPEVESEPLPWALELADGEQCTLATGATAAFAGMRVNYFCSGGGSVLGEPDRGFPVWAVTYLPEGAFAADLIDVAAVWH